MPATVLLATVAGSGKSNQLPRPLDTPTIPLVAPVLDSLSTAAPGCASGFFATFGSSVPARTIAPSLPAWNDCKDWPANKLRRFF